ncbi:ferrichrome-iron receptor precursor [mine drainage metagenome]|uniref:Ferrichrome-iron receptor n=1 Tax=mine drainage metagenome TaxID=410659 RepID=A0A1J5SUG4_9ZZZZ
MQTPSKLTLIASLALATALRAQTVPPSRDAGNGAPQQLDRFVVTGVPIEDSVNPLSRTSSAIMGDNRGPLDTPRAASTITSGLFNERQIDGVQEILLYSPSAYVGAAYGNITTPNIRGDLAETYLNGQRLSYNFYGYFPSFNGVEAVDLVRGPGSVVFGAGYFTGGYVNYVSKQPKFSGPQTTVTVRLGTFAPGHVSYRNGSVQIDTTAPINDKLAWRLSYEAKGGQTFFRKNDAHDDRQDIYGALTWKPDDDTRVDFNIQFFWQNAPETLGVNRVTQQLIDSGLYYTGTSADTTPYPGPIPATGPVKLPWSATLFSIGDFSNANVFRTQLIARHTVSPTLTVINRTLFEYVNRRRYQQFEYAEYVTQHTFENRTEFHFDWSGARVPQTATGGFTVRYAHSLSFENYFNEYIYNFDVTDPSRVFNEAAQFPNSYFPGLPGPNGALFFPTAWGSPETVNSSLWDAAGFWQHEVRLAPKVSLIAGVRGDLYYGLARDPIPPPDTVPWRDSATVGAFSPTASLLYRPASWMSLYATYQRIRAVNGNLAGGGLILTDRGDGVGVLNRDDFRNRSDLAEAGAKFSLLDRKLYAAAALFDQRRTRIGLGGEHDDIDVRGLELESVYQPSSNLSATANLTLQEGHWVDSAPFQMGGRSIYDAYLLGTGPGGLGTSTGSYDPYANQVPAGDWQLIGFSRAMANGSVRYRFDSGFGVGVNASWQSWQRGNIDNQWHIPAQYTLNASLFYQTKRWIANIDFLNVTDQRNWIHNGDAYTASELIFPAQPFRIEGYVKIRY